jgi:putative flippase GtrA
MVIHFTKKVLNLKVVRYFFTAVTATVVDVSMYFVAYNFILHKKDISYSGFTITAPTLSLMISFCFGLTTNFILTRLLVFTNSDLRLRHQFLRYSMVAFLMLILNYILMTILIRNFQWYPTLSRATAAVSVGFISFIVHKTFSFRVRDDEDVDEVMID